MSQPAPRAAPPAPAPTSAPPRPSRWIERATSLLLAVATGATLAAATPALLRAAGAELPSGSPSDSTPPIALPHRPPEILAHPDGPEIPGALLDDQDGDADDAL